MKLIDRMSAMATIAIVGVILVVGVFLPITSDATVEEVDYTNSSGALFRMEEIGLDDTYTLKYTVVDSQAVVTYDLNGESWSYAKAESSDLDISPVMWDNGFIRQGLTSSGKVAMSIFVINNGQYEETRLLTGTMTITFDKGTVTFTSSTGSDAPSANSTYTRVYVPAPADGDYVMYNTASLPATLTGDTEIYAWGTTFTPYSEYYTAKLHVAGTVDDMAVTAYAADSGSAVGITPAVSDIAVNSADFGYNGEKFTSVTFNLQITGYDSKAATFNQVMVPYAVTVEEYNDSPTSTIISILPVLIMVGLLVSVVALSIGRSKE